MTSRLPQLHAGTLRQPVEHRAEQQDPHPPTLPERQRLNHVAATTPDAYFCTRQHRPASRRAAGTGVPQ
jgi:hypothetical protein